MLFPTLSCGTLIARYKRFLADIQLANGEMITLHCPNTGAMTGCAEPGSRVWFSTSDNPKRKYAHTWELTETKQGDFICVNTLRANQLVKEALEHQWLAAFRDYHEILPEVKYGNENSRIDFLLKNAQLTDCYVEVKSTTLLTQNGVGMFPDAKTARGQKHLRELIAIQQQGKRAAVLFAVLHTGITQFDVARQIDAAYANTLDEAKWNDVAILVYKAKVLMENNRPVGMELNQPIAYT